MPKPPTYRRTAGGGSSAVWKDESLADWPANDHRIFVGNLASDVTDEILSASFRHLKSFQRSKIVRDKKSLKCKGFGFVSFGDPVDMLTALKEINGKYIGSKPCQLKRSKWEEKSVKK